jgi:hypothetical protein
MKPVLLILTTLLPFCIKATPADGAELEIHDKAVQQSQCKLGSTREFYHEPCACSSPAGKYNKGTDIRVSCSVNVCGK